MDAFKQTSWTTKDPETKFGTGTRPPLNNPNGGPGPGAYVIKSTMGTTGKLLESHIPTPNQFSIRGRTKFGDPNARAISKTAANEPGPGQYDLTGKFVSGRNPRKSAFPKAVPMRDKGVMGPGPGSYQPLQSMGKQVLSTKTGNMEVGFPKAPRPTLVPPGTTEIGPADYKPSPAACEPQVESRKRTCATIKFGEGYNSNHNNERKKFDFSDPAPGPGSYRLPGGVATKAKGSPFRNSPAAILSSRQKFGSPFKD
jgi:hypothetical protein